jgi:hypothetical protein
MRNAFLTVLLIYMFLYVSIKVSWVGAQYCGNGSYEYINSIQCESANWEDGCKIPESEIKRSTTVCYLNADKKCMGGFYWTGCYVTWDRDKYKCVYKSNYTSLPCGVYGGGGGGGSYEYTRCPEGQVLSCGTVAEAGSQNKKRPADGFAKRISGWESPHPIIRLSA